MGLHDLRSSSTNSASPLAGSRWLTISFHASGFSPPSLKAYVGCRARLRELAALLRALDVENGGHTAAADLVLLYASTQTWFAAEREYKVRPHACAAVAKFFLVMFCLYVGTYLFKQS